MPPGGPYQPRPQQPQYPDPAQRLQELQKQLEHDQADITRLTQQSDTLKADIAALSGVGDAIKEVLKTYKEALPNLKNEFSDDANYADTKMRMILCAVEQYKGAIDQKIADYDRKVEQKAAALEQLKAQKEQAQKQLEVAEKDLENKQKQFDYWKNLKTDTDAKLAEIRDLKTQIEKADDLSQAATMYFLTLELIRILRSIKIVSPEELKERLYATWNQLSQAKENVRRQKSAADAAAAAVDAAQKEFDDLKAKRRENILEKIAVFDERGSQNKPQQQQAAKAK